MKNAVIAFLLAALGFSSCGVSKKASGDVSDTEKTAVERKDSTTVVGKPVPDAKAVPEIRVMYGPPPSIYRK